MGECGRGVLIGYIHSWTIRHDIDLSASSTPDWGGSEGVERLGSAQNQRLPISHRG